MTVPSENLILGAEHSLWKLFDVRSRNFHRDYHIRMPPISCKTDVKAAILHKTDD